MKLHIKNMVCSRCKMVVKSVFENLSISTISVELGEVELKNDIQEKQKQELLKNLRVIGFDLIDDRKSKTIDKIKTIIIDLVQNKNNDLKTNLSDFLSQQIHQDYNTLSNLFSEVENTTIEKYFINQKIEKVKELIIYDELSLSEIAYSLNYSSVSHLSNQFKKATGFSPTYFKNLKSIKRKQIEDL
ncbi:AraC family transcriptional regulator [Flavobacterium sp. GT3R68]|uniref:helix-turn-helix domain-containing protein n=1 Tax=Flavobacterium sp. GT3R68 TaxID=2594437 RepID=UPI000F867C23|nr:AraC family transcriptional regulator [Flavobacterium sp. GT3R68]RTY89840.1 AraC family transcriptional regulator [Flavobacterium sp. GSN2]TRW89819.1 helix-turn-helix transcriptional regulator [Flavobacterium sp. GT3R68]